MDEFPVDEKEKFRYITIYINTSNLHNVSAADLKQMASLASQILPRRYANQKNIHKRKPKVSKPVT